VVEREDDTDPNRQGGRPYLKQPVGYGTKGGCLGCLMVIVVVALVLILLALSSPKLF
jgi:hypothetical protein